MKPPRLRCGGRSLVNVVRMEGEQAGGGVPGTRRPPCRPRFIELSSDGDGGVSTSGAPPTLDFRALAGGPWGTFVYGVSRPLVLRVVYAMAVANDPSPTWVAIRDPHGGRDPASPSELGWIPEDHLFIVSATDAKPQAAATNQALWTVVRSDEPHSVAASFTDFLRLPPAIQVAVSQVQSPRARPVFVIANSDRVRGYYPTEPAGVRPIIEAMLAAGLLPIFAAVGPPGEGRTAFDFVFEVDATDLDAWRSGALICHKAPRGMSAPLETRIPLASLSQATEYFEGRLPRRG